MKLRNFIKYFIVFFVVLSVFLMGILTLVEVQKKNRMSQSIVDNEKNNVANQTSVLAEELNSVLSDLRYLRESFQISMDKNEKHETIANEWRVFSKNKRIYDQIRYIDESGEEVIRVNYSDKGAYIVENEYLQNKSDRYYFKDSVNLDKNTIYISPFDLNIENGMVEVPIKPMIRVSTPVYDNLGDVKGVIILNYLAHNVLDKITDNLSNNEGEINLVNEDGYWLYSGDSKQDWGFMYPERNNISFKASYPDEWSRIIAGENEIITSNGLFISKEITLENKVIDEPKNNLVFGKGTWIVVSHIEKDNPASYYVLAGFWSIVGKSLIGNYFVLMLSLFFSGIIAYLFLKNRYSFNQIKFFSEYDDMTGSYNRRAGLLILKRKIFALKSEDDLLTICFLDVNGLKRVNDGLGHNFGDELLETVAATIKKEIRDKDILARLGGDEFLLVLDGINKEITRKVWERIYNNFTYINNKGKRPYVISVSYGLVEVNGKSRKSVDELIKEADLKMYENKEKDRGEIDIIKNKEE
ncbi:MAG: diguanylate cyclase [Clostridiales bacterium]|nr:diguanylate cyclase [Clostridiales bacterium]